MSEEFEIKIEISLDSPLKFTQKNTLFDGFSEVIKQNDGKINSQSSMYVEKRSLELLILTASLGVSASILSIVNSVLGISKNLGDSQKKAEVFVKRKDGNFIKVDDEMDADELRKQLEK